MVKLDDPPQPEPRVIPSNNMSNKTTFGIRDNILFIIVLTSFNFALIFINHRNFPNILRFTSAGLKNFTYSMITHQIHNKQVFGI